MSKIDWSNYSKSTVAIAMNESVAPSQFPCKWHEFILVPHSNDSSVGFWTLLGVGEHHPQMLINPKFEPKLKCNWKKSLYVRPEIQKEVKNRLNLDLPANKWDEAIIDCVNSWLQYDIKMSVSRLNSTRKRLKTILEDDNVKDDKGKEEYYSDEESEQRIG